MRAFRTDPPTDFRSYPLKILLDADIGKVHTQRIRDRLPLSMRLTDPCERRSSVSKCTPEWDEKLSFLATGCPTFTFTFTFTSFTFTFTRVAQDVSHDVSLYVCKMYIHAIM